MKIKSYKGMDKNMQCRGFQYEVGGEYETDKADVCHCGFHACEVPLDVFSFYDPTNGNRFFEVEQFGEISTQKNNSKIASSKILIDKEIGIKGLIAAHIEYIKSKCEAEKTTGDCSALTGGDRSALTGGDRSALTGGARSALTGGYSSALTGGDDSALTGGDRSALAGGYSSALTGGDNSALTGGDSSALTGGDRSALTGGDCSALTGGDCSALTGGYGSVVYGGCGAKVRGGMWSVLALQVWEDDTLIGVKSAIVDGKKIKKDVWYTLKNGKFTEVEEDDE